MRTPRMALVGSGEFLPVMEPVDRALLDGAMPDDGTATSGRHGRARRVAVIPTSAALDGPDRVQYWLDLGADHYRRLGASAVEVPALTRLEAEDAEMAARVEGCALLYLSGGNPGYLADTLRDTALWQAILAAYGGGAALAGCSAGAMALTALAPHIEHGVRHFAPGLRVVPYLAVIPHFDRIGGWYPGIVDSYFASLSDGVTLVGIDEDTALLGAPEQPHGWTVMGRQHVYVLHRDGTRTKFANGDTVDIEAA